MKMANKQCHLMLDLYIAASGRFTVRYGTGTRGSGLRILATQHSQRAPACCSVRHHLPLEPVLSPGNGCQLSYYRPIPITSRTGKIFTPVSSFWSDFITITSTITYSLHFFFGCWAVLLVLGYYCSFPISFRQRAPQNPRPDLHNRTRNIHLPAQIAKTNTVFPMDKRIRLPKNSHG